MKRKLSMHRLIYVLIFTSANCLVPTGMLLSQSLDSVKRVVATQDTEKGFETILSIMRSNLNTNPDSSLKISYYALEYAKAARNPLNVIRANYAMAFINYKRSDFKECIRIVDKLLPVLRFGLKDDPALREHLINTLNLKSLSHFELLQYKEALKFYDEQLLLLDNSEDYSSLGVLYNNIGFTYHNLNNAKEAYNNFIKSLDYKMQANDEFDLEVLYFNLALVSLKLEQLQDANSYIELGFAQCKKSNCSDFIKTMGYHVKARYFKFLMQTDSLRKYADISIQYGKRVNHRIKISENYSILYSHYLEINRNELAAAYLDSAEKVLDNKALPITKLFIHADKMTFYKKIGNETDYKKSKAIYQQLLDTLVQSEGTIEQLIIFDKKLNERISSYEKNNRDAESENLKWSIVVFVGILSLSTISYLIFKNKKDFKSKTNL